MRPFAAPTRQDQDGSPAVRRRSHRWQSTHYGLLSHRPPGQAHLDAADPPWTPVSSSASRRAPCGRPQLWIPALFPLRHRRISIFEDEAHQDSLLNDSKSMPCPKCPPLGRELVTVFPAACVASEHRLWPGSRGQVLDCRVEDEAEDEGTEVEPHTTRCGDHLHP